MHRISGRQDIRPYNMPFFIIWYPAGYRYQIALPAGYPVRLYTAKYLADPIMYKVFLIIRQEKICALNIYLVWRFAWCKLFLWIYLTFYQKYSWQPKYPAGYPVSGPYWIPVSGIRLLVYPDMWLAGYPAKTLSGASLFRAGHFRYK
jgi:hypothetical protein